MIDWFTVIAQIVNFLILVAILKYFLYSRIVAAMSRRKQDIAARWAEAEQQRDEAAKEVEIARGKNRELDEQRELLLARVRDDVEEYRQQLTAKTRSEVEDLQSRWADAIEEETGAFLRDIRRRASEEVCAIARRALSDLADAELERQVVQCFLDKVDSIGERERSEVLDSMKDGEHVVVVQTAWKLPDELREAVVHALQRSFLSDLDVQFEESADLVCGVALQTDAHKLAWDVRDYLASLEQELQRTLEEETAVKRQRGDGAAMAAR